MKLQFEWDEAKNKSNHLKHGVWFEEAQTVWADPMAKEFFDPDNSTNEGRFLRIGRSVRNRALMIVFCERGGGESVRIISARKATLNEVRQYEEGI